MMQRQNKDIMKSLNLEATSDASTAATVDFFLRCADLAANKEGWTPYNMKTIKSFLSNAKSLSSKFGVLSEKDHETINNMAAEIITLVGNPGEMGAPNLKQIPPMMADLGVIFNFTINKPKVKNAYDKIMEILTKLGEGNI